MEKEIHYAFLASPIGKLSLVATNRGLVLLDFIDLEESFIDNLGKRFPGRLLVKDGGFIKEPLEEIKEYFLGSRREFTCPLDIDLEGTPFQKKVWQALREIPYGETVSYEDIAQKIGNIKAVRAVGLANGQNPIPIIIPCHRVIRKSGHLGGYNSGLERKVFLLEWEKGRNMTKAWNSPDYNSRNFWVG